MHASLRSFGVVVTVLLAASTARASAIGQPVAAPEASRFASTIGAHETAFDFDRRHAGRAHNVELAAAHLDGVILEPGDELSFNETVGPRTLAAGFMEAPELHGGHLHEGVGGGVCQVATTLHVAALQAGLEILEHETHSIPLHYAPAGLDATVFYGRIDYRVRNPHAFAVRVRASAVEGRLVIQLEGADERAPATIETRVVRRFAPSEQTIPDASLPAGARVVEERGREGLVVRVRAVRADGTRTERIERYRAAPRVVRVAG